MSEPKKARVKCGYCGWVTRPMTQHELNTEFHGCPSCAEITNLQFVEVLDTYGTKIQKDAYIKK